MMRYRPASISPGAKRPEEISLLEDVRDGTGEVGFFAPEAGVAGAAVGISLSELTGWPHSGQNRAVPGTPAPQ
jgi:hypothetical protein